MAATDPAHLVFLDETSTPTTLTPLRARSPRGQRAYGRVPRGQRTAVTLLATLTPTGLGPGYQFAGALDRPTFEQFVEQILLPSLSPGQTVILDNLSVHKSARAQHLIEAAGCELVFLPTYSPDFNPIEPAFAKLKQHLRKVEARTVDAILTATHQHYRDVTPADARSFYQDAGYSLPAQLI
jgi:transposase